MVDAAAIEMIRAEIENNLSERVYLRDLARKAGMNVHKLTTLFRCFVGYTITDYHIRMRMIEAVNLLIDTDFSITQIAYEVGYSNVRSFGKEFKKHCWFTATEYREVFG